MKVYKHGLFTPNMYLGIKNNKSWFFEWQGRSPIRIYLVRDLIDMSGFHFSIEVFLQKPLFQFIRYKSTQFKYLLFLSIGWIQFRIAFYKAKHII
jgi:hypothetical protein